MKTVEEAMAALARLTDWERREPAGPEAFDLARPRRLLTRLGRPDERLGARVVQVAGTKGKGSTARFLESALRAAGLRTGLFTSPHLERPTERIAVDGRPIADADFGARVAQVLAAVEDETFFEALLAAACLHFAAVGTDAVVLEVGLGGRLDATTAVPATHTVITTIGYDHARILGDSLAVIAAEKAAVIRPGVPVWSGVDPASEAGRVIAQTARERAAPLVHVPPPADVRADRGGIAFDGYHLPLLGRHQAHNAALAVAACADLPPAALRRGLAAARQPACCEPRGRRPTVLLDGAHTPDSVAATLRAVADHFPGARPQLVFALAKDKDLDGIAAELAPRVDRVFATRADERRGLDAGRLAAHPAWRDKATALADPREALERARATAGAGGLVLVTGSLYLAGAVRRYA